MDLDQTSPIYMGLNCLFFYLVTLKMLSNMCSRQLVQAANILSVFFSGVLRGKCTNKKFLKKSCLTQIRSDVVSGLVWIQTVCTLVVEITHSVTSALSMPNKKDTMLMLVNFLPTILVVC